VPLTNVVMMYRPKGSFSFGLLPEPGRTGATIRSSARSWPVSPAGTVPASWT
jgi:hypothetical protein